MKERMVANENVIITEDNIIGLSESISIGCLRYRINYCYTKLDKMYRNLLRDIRNSNVQGYTYTSSYDIVSTASCFLCEHIGKSLGNPYDINRYGRPRNLLRACYSVVNKYIANELKHIKTCINFTEYMPYDDGNIEYKELFKHDTSNVDNIIEKMNLTQGQLDTLNCYMAGMGYIEISKFLNVERTTLFYRKKKIALKYNLVMGTCF